MEVTRHGIFGLFYETFNMPVPEVRFVSMWNSANVDELKGAMHKAKRWYDSHPGKTNWDVARIITSILRDQRNIKRRISRLYTNTQ